MQWDSGANAGFTTGTPWIILPDHCQTINVEVERQDPDSILNYYKRLIQLRKENPVVSDGKIEFLCCDCAEVFAYRRFLGGDELLVFNNLTEKEILLSDTPWTGNCKKVIGNYADAAVKEGRLVLRPYKSIAFQQ